MSYYRHPSPSISTPRGPSGLCQKPSDLPDLEDLGQVDFRHQKNSDHPISSRDKPIQRVPADSAHFCLYRGLGLEPVCIASGCRDLLKSDPVSYTHLRAHET